MQAQTPLLPSKWTVGCLVWASPTVLTYSVALLYLMSIISGSSTVPLLSSCFSSVFSQFASPVGHTTKSEWIGENKESSMNQIKGTLNSGIYQKPREDIQRKNYNLTHNPMPITIYSRFRRFTLKFMCSLTLPTDFNLLIIAFT